MQRVDLKVSSAYARRLCQEGGHMLAGALFRNGDGVIFRLWDLGDRLPASDRSGRMLEAYTTVFEVNGVRYLSVTEREAVERHGFKARVHRDEIAFEVAGLIPHTVRFAD